MTEIMKDVRMPLFCPKCDKVMKKRLDNKMWNLFQHCFDCQVEIEHKLKLEGKFDDWANEKMRKNKDSNYQRYITTIRRIQNYESTRMVE